MTLEAAIRPQRTHPKTFAVKAATMLTQLVVPIVVGGYTILDDGDLADLLTYFLPLIVVVIGLQFVLAYLQWTRLTYEVRESDIRVESGLLSRAARSVPYERIQDVSVEQKLIPRLFGLVEVKFETGAGGGDDLKLAYLTEAEGDRLRDTVKARREGREVSEAAVEVEVERAEANVLFAMPPRRVLTFGLFEFSLAVVAVVFGAVQQLDFLIDFDLWDIDEWQQRLAGPEQYLAGLGPLAQFVGIAAGVAALLAVGVTTGIVRTALREWNFLLERTETGLRRRRGLVTRTDVVMPIHRVQALRLKTSFVRRLFGWYGLGVVSLASDSASANHEAAPFARMQEIEPIAATTGFALPSGEMCWNRRSAKASVDGALINLAFTGAIAIPVWLFSPLWWSALVPLSIGVLGAVREYYLYRFDRHSLGDRFIYSRHGWLAPKTTIGSRVRFQSVEIKQGPLAKLRGYAVLKLGLAGGTFEVEAMPVEQAQRWRSAILDSIATTDFSQMLERKPSDAQV
ncbi:PH domain-containing protein [Qipengyuania sp. 902]|uniref:PH domain-containing protein n=1 Tax=Qipengyuania sp. 902 TaxID=3417565 RepID=UPI003EBE9783